MRGERRHAETRGLRVRGGSCRGAWYPGAGNERVTAPAEKRLSYADNISDNKEMWEDDDGLKDYTKEVQKSFVDTIIETANSGGEIGKEIGEVFGMGKTGEAIGKVAGTVVGVVKSIGSAIGSLFGW